MPKETVHESMSAKAIEITWGRDQAHVIVGSRWDQPFRFTSPDGMPVDPAGDGDPNYGIPGVFESLHVTFTDRGSVNDLIRVLRRARDSAFGADA